MSREFTNVIVDTKNEPVSKILKVKTGNISNKLNLPRYQREYSWLKDDVEKLIQDFINHHRSKSTIPYYLGNFVFVTSSNPNDVDILDGQQRIISLYILSAALKHCLYTLHEEIKENLEIAESETDLRIWEREIKESIKNINGVLYKPILDRDNQETGRAPRISIFYPKDKDQFDPLVTLDQPFITDNSIDKRTKIYKAGLVFIEEITKYLQDEKFNDPDTQLYYEKKFVALTELIEYILGEAAEVTYTTVKQGEEFTIFETLNDRGKNLNCYDLTRNYFLNSAANLDDNNDSNSEEILSKKVEKAFDTHIKTNCLKNDGTSNDNNRAKTIVNDWNMSHDGKIGSSKYMTLFQKEASNSWAKASRPNSERISNLEEHLNRLKISSRSFKELTKPGSIESSTDFGNENNNQKKDLAMKLSLFQKTGFKQHYSLYMALRYRNHKIKDLIKYIDFIEKIYVNLILIFERSPSSIETILSDFAFDIYSEKAPIEELLAEHIEKIREFDIDFNTVDNKFKYIKTNSPQTQYLLRRISNAIANNSVTDYVKAEATVEHIMPQDKEEWVTIDEDTHNKNLERLGNKTLLTQTMNSINGKKPFSFKKNIYEEESWPITNSNKKYSVTNYSDWGEDSIDKRQTELSKFVKDIWGF